MFKTIFLISLAFSASSGLFTANTPPEVKLIDRGDTYATFEISGNDTLWGEKITGISARYRISGDKIGLRMATKGDVRVSISSFRDQSGLFRAEVKVNNLLASKTYFFSFVGTTKSGRQSEPTRELRVDILPSVPNVSWNRLDNGILELQWNNTDHADETNYTIGVAKNTSLSCGYSVTLAKCFGSSYTLTQLEPGTVYRLELYAESSAGRSRSAIIYYPE